MIQEAVKEILSIIDRVPHLAMWVLTGLLIWKLVYIGSVFGVIRLAILSIKEMYSKRVENDLKKQELEKQPTVKYHDIGGLFISDEAKEMFIQSIREFQAASQDSREQKLNYVFVKDVEWFRDAVKQKVIAQAEKK